MTDYQAMATNKKISDLYRKIKDENLILQPDFQRLIVWNSKHQQDFIDTILKGLPFPEIYIADEGVDLEKYASREVVVDGQQRLSTIVQYIDGELLLKGGAHIPAYSELSKDDKSKFLNYPVIIRELRNVDRDTIKEIFRRINLTRYSLNAYEIQHALYDGEFISLAQKINRNKKFQLIPTFKESDSMRMQDLGFILSVMTTIEHGGYFTYDREIEAYVKKFNSEYPNMYKQEKQLESVVDKINDLGLENDSTWFRKSNLYTLFVELINHSECNITKKQLESFEADILNSKESGVKSDFKEYYSYMYTGTNSRQARVERGRIFRKYIFGINE